MGKFNNITFNTIKVENLIKKIRWTPLRFLRKLEQSKKTTFGFRSRRCPPTVEELANFKSDLMLVIKNMQLRFTKIVFKNTYLRISRNYNKAVKYSFQLTNVQTFTKWKKKNMRSYYLNVTKHI